MSPDILQFKTPIILFGNGVTPTHPAVLKKISEANSILCVDGGADKLEKIGYYPALILGDLDSLIHDPGKYKCDLMHLDDQSRTDLEKSLEWCFSRGIKDLSLVGFSGGRDDHTVAVLWTLLSYAHRMNLVLYSNYSTVQCVKDDASFNTFPGQIISIIPTNKNTKITTQGLKFPLNDSSLNSPGHGISNVADGDQCSIRSTEWVWVFFNFAE